MSKRKKEDNLLADGVITEEAMTAYLGNTLSTAERTQFEKLLAEDPFAQDALEGMQAAPNRSETQARIAGINKKIRHQTGGREHKTINIHWANYVWAAVVLGLLVGIGFLMVTYLNNNGDESLAQNEAPQEIVMPAPDTVAVSSTIVADSISATDTTQVMETLLAADSVSYKYTSATTVDKNMAAEQKSVKQSPPSTAAAMQPAVASAPVKKEEAGKAKRAETVKADDAEADVVVVQSKKVANDMKAENARVAETKAASGGAANKAVPTQAEAMQNFNSGNYKASSEQFEAILKSQPNNADAQYFGGVSDYLNGNLSKSEKQFDKLLKSGTRYTEGSKWYKANILIKKGKKEDAKKILNELSNTNNSYKERATNKLKDLQ